MKNTQSQTQTITNIPTQYDRSTLTTKWVHIGFGAFHRAHQALLTHQLAAMKKTDWGICEVNLLGGEALINDLRAQDHRYSVLEKGATGSEIKVIDIIKESLHSGIDGVAAVINKLSQPEIQLVSLTITEKGYCLDPNTGHLMKDNPVIVHDIENPDKPDSALGIIVSSLKVRKENDLKPFSVLSCDNIQGNGHIMKKAVLEYAQLLDSSLANWIESNVSFPCTMVDRIVPSVTQETFNDIEKELGCKDPCGVACEPFIQWVIEDNFVNGRPDWDLVGAQFVADVIPYEEMKLRMLNGSHSFLAYLGYLAGYQTIDEAVADKDFYHAAKQVMLQEQAPTLNMPQGTDLEQYAKLLLERYSNQNLKHRTWQIAMDGSQKLPQRFLKSIANLIKQGKSYSYLALAVAGWMVYVGGKDEQGQAIDVRDPMADTLRSICDKAETKESLVKQLINVDSIFGEFSNNKEFITTITDSYLSLTQLGAQKAVAELNKK